MSNYKWSIILFLGAILTSSAQDTSGQCTYGPGYYCGTSIGKQADHLYYCDNGLWTDKEACQFGCFANKPGYPDYCFQSLNATISYASPASSNISTSHLSAAIPSGTQNLINAHASPTASSTSSLTPSPSPSQNMTLIWSQAIDSFIKDVSSNTTHINEHLDAMIGNMLEITGVERIPSNEKPTNSVSTDP
ncbi:hypothetical protein K450DRAFT_250443 [Umbelopsis ramanniana AG]|uniref:Uncharacterized protein n=1 Tax=Umbelopsis ramanniana AG TaxID=1314678 RepID=A0AAD5E6P8_UMBRA|nr:uncharacterized protein K450DRAFT_250443 [Umbelopsis ramanniana AG]KAI8577699.1 hypothetical protein K450DRAFT_250443 [Umbelopsis ramanniana AG]